MRIELDLIRCDQIAIPENYPRSSLQQSNVSEIAESIKDFGGVIRPILLQRLSTGQMILLKGSRRLLGTIKNGTDSIPALIIGDRDDDEAINIAAILHLGSQPLSPFDTATLVEKLRVSRNLGHLQISTMIGWGNGDSGRVKVGNYLRLLKLPPDVLEFFKGESALPVTYSLQLLRLSDDPESQVWVAEKIVRSNLSIQQTSNLIDHIQEAGKKPEREGNGKESDLSLLSSDYYKKISSVLETQYGCSLRLKKLTNGKMSMTIQVNEENLKQLLDNFNQ